MHVSFIVLLDVLSLTSACCVPQFLSLTFYCWLNAVKYESYQSVFTLRLKPTAKNFSGHISDQVQYPNFSPLGTVSRDLYCLSVKAMPARCRKFFSSQNPLDNTASMATMVERLAILTAMIQCFSLKCQLTSTEGSGSKLL